MIIKEIPVKEKTTQISAEDKPSPAYKSMITLQDSSPQNLEDVNNGDASYDSSNTIKSDDNGVIAFGVFGTIFTTICDLHVASKTGVYRSSLKRKYSS